MLSPAKFGVTYCTCTCHPENTGIRETLVAAWESHRRGCNHDPRTNFLMVAFGSLRVPPLVPWSRSGIPISQLQSMVINAVSEGSVINSRAARKNFPTVFLAADLP
jgi:hypothetical protein